MDLGRRVVGLAGVLAGGVTAIRVLHRLGAAPWLRVGWDDPAGWLAVVAPEDAVMSVVRLVALAAAYWLVVTTVVYMLARASRLPAAIRSVRWATLPAVRGVVDRAVAVTLAGSAVAVGAVGSHGIAAAAVALPPALSAPADLPGDPLDADEPAVTVPPDAAQDSAGVVTVVPGDNLWAITAGLLAPGASDAEVHGPWRAIIDANRDRLRSGDPNLIYPGEQIQLPGLMTDAEVSAQDPS